MYMCSWSRALDRISCPIGQKNHKNHRKNSSYENCSHFWDIFQKKLKSVPGKYPHIYRKYTECDKRIKNNSL